MNILYIPYFLLILLFGKYVYNRYLCYNPKVKKFDEKVESKYNLYQINLFQDNNLIKLIHLNHYFHTLSEFNVDKYIQLNELFGINYNKIFQTFHHHYPFILSSYDTIFNVLHKVIWRLYYITIFILFKIGVQ